MKRVLAAATAAAAVVSMLISAAPASAYSAASLSGVAGSALPSSTVIAAFSDGLDIFSCNPASTYTATANWGDGDGALPATVSGPIDPGSLEPCEYSVSAGHTYSLPGSYPLTVDVTGGGDPGSATGVVKVADVPISAGPSSEFSGVAGKILSGVAGTFTAGNPLAPTSYYSATVDWGDGSHSSATVSTGQTPGGLTVSAGHAYGLPGNYVATVTLNDGDGETSTLTDHLAVADAGLRRGKLLSLSASQGVPLHGTIAQFSTPDTLAPASFYTATIEWGDGSSSTGKVVGTRTPGEFLIESNHAYRSAGTMDAVVTVTDGAKQSITMSEPVTVNLLAGQLSPVAAPAIQTQPGSEFSGKVIDFGYRGGSAGDLKAVVNWGDGQTTQASVVELNSSPIYGDVYAVEDDHLYVAAGYYPVRVTVRAADGKVITVPMTAVVEGKPGAQFTLPLGDVQFPPDAIAVHLRCPAGDALCRGYLSASVKLRGVATVLTTTYFILPAGHSAVIDMPLYESQLQQLGIRGLAQIDLKADVLEPGPGKHAIAELTVTHRFPG